MEMTIEVGLLLSFVAPGQYPGHVKIIEKESLALPDFLILNTSFAEVVS